MLSELEMQNRRKLFFGCDIRSLAVFRVAAAMLVLVDAYVRYGAAESFYSGSGFLSSSLAKELSPDGYSLNYLSDAVGFQQGIFIALGGSALLLCLGCFTRAATFCCWILLASIHVRNPTYIIGGDTLLRMMLFWSLFIPLGRAWSVDRWLINRRARRPGVFPGVSSVVCSVGTGCLLLQICVMYWTAGLSKLNEPWLNGTAMEYIFRLDCYARPLSGWLIQSPLFVAILTYATLVVELLVPFGVFFPYKTAKLRICLVGFFIVFHIGIGLTMDVGKFTYVSMVAWLPFLPSMFWNRFAWAQIVDSEKGAGVANSLRTPGLVHRVASASLSVLLPLTLFIYVVIWNVAGLFGAPGNTWLERSPDSLYRFGEVTMLKQNFQMFCIPARTNTTYLFNGRTIGGERVDLVRNHPAAQTGPGAALPQAREWKTLHWYLISFGGEPQLFEGLLEYHSRIWNRSARSEQQIVEARLERYIEEFGPGIAPGSFVHIANVADWRDPEQGDVSSERLKQDFDHLMDQMENGALFPMD